MQLAYLELQNDSHSFFSAIVLAALFPVLHDDDLFEARFITLFGSTKIMSFSRALLAYSSQESIMPLLNSLIDEQLRPRLVSHLLEKSDSYASYFEPEESLAQCVDAIRSKSPIQNTSGLARILSIKLHCTIKIYEHTLQTILYNFTPPSCPLTTTPAVIFLSQEHSQYYPLFDSELLLPPPYQTHHPLPPYLQKMEPAKQSRIELIMSMHEHDFKQLVQKTLRQMPEQLYEMQGILGEKCFHS